MKPKIISQIYEANPSYDYCYDNDEKVLRKIECQIRINNLEFTGSSKVHKDDKDFISTKFGCRLAKYRARYNALTYYLYHYEQFAKSCRKYFCDVAQGQEKDNVDPTGRFTNQMYRYWHYVDCIRDERKNLKKAIDATIKSQERMIKVVKKYREDEVDD